MNRYRGSSIEDIGLGTHNALEFDKLNNNGELIIDIGLCNGMNENLILEQIDDYNMHLKKVDENSSDKNINCYLRKMNGIILNLEKGIEKVTIYKTFGNDFISHNTEYLVLNFLDDKNGIDESQKLIFIIKNKNTINVIGSNGTPINFINEKIEIKKSLKLKLIENDKISFDDVKNIINTNNNSEDEIYKIGLKEVAPFQQVSEGDSTNEYKGIYFNLNKYDKNIMLVKGYLDNSQNAEIFITIDKNYINKKILKIETFLSLKRGIGIEIIKVLKNYFKINKIMVEISAKGPGQKFWYKAKILLKGFVEIEIKKKLI